MSLIPHIPNVPGIRQALDLIKGALDERDGWELLAAADEKKQMAQPSRRLSTRQGSNSGGRSGGTGRVNRLDLRCKPPTSRVPDQVPRNLRNKITWATMRYNAALITSGASIVETNFAFGLNATAQSATWLALFDQYCIVQASITFELQSAYVTSGITGQIYTAIDFDNITNIGSVQAIENFSTCVVTQISAESSVTRSCKPCLPTDVNGAAGVAVGRQWIDSAFNNVPHYGIRSIIGVSTAVSITPIVTLWVAFRSVI